MGSDIPSAHGSQFSAGNNFSITHASKSREETDALFAKLSDGGTVTMPPAGHVLGLVLRFVLRQVRHPLAVRLRTAKLGRGAEPRRCRHPVATVSSPASSPPNSLQAKNLPHPLTGAGCFCASTPTSDRTPGHGRNQRVSLRNRPSLSTHSPTIELFTGPEVEASIGLFYGTDTRYQEEQNMTSMSLNKIGGLALIIGPDLLLPWTFWAIKLGTNLLGRD